MSNDQTADDRTTDSPYQPSLETFAWPQDLRHAHNFAATAQPIMELGVATTPPPLRQNQSGTSQDVIKRYGAPAMVSGGPAETDFLIESRLGDDDAPFHAPVSWSHPPPVPSRRRQWQWNERSIAAFLGFAAGVMIIIPAVMYLGSGDGSDSAPKLGEITTTSAPQKSTSEAQTIPVAARQQAAAAKFHTVVANATPRLPGGWFDSNRVPAPVPVSGTSVLREKQAAADNAERSARAALADGRVAEARDALRAAASPDTPKLWFILAETYDPRVARGGSADAASSSDMAATDLKFARYYYAQALTYGIEEARRRIQTLPE